MLKTLLSPLVYLKDTASGMNVLFTLYVLVAVPRQDSMRLACVNADL